MFVPYACLISPDCLNDSGIHKKLKKTSNKIGTVSGSFQAQNMAKVKHQALMNV